MRLYVNVYYIAKDKTITLHEVAIFTFDIESAGLGKLGISDFVGM